MIYLEKNGLTVPIFISLRDKVGFVYYRSEDVAEALKKTCYSVVAKDDENAVGMARVVGDNRIAFFIKDVVVDPAYQGRGIGDLIMEDIMRHIKNVCADDAYVGLMSTPGRESFYEKYGFIVRPNEKFGSGMVQYIKTGKSKQEA